MTDVYILSSQGSPLALFEHQESDMWYLFGKIEPIQSGKVDINKIFEVTKTLDFKIVMSDWSQGYRCELESEDSSIPCVLMECNSRQVSLRMLSAEETIEWSNCNIRPLSTIYS
ncbi:hypothetical protein BI308_24720 [Roseofilum reptotaenium AO1-A]|uniref:Uncharacterized protein n=1 Tax=Roseofilum reptotaenium AO1-A TaxID=1925591 RepID=A0A1L9QJQ8_9CYAN|nr:hypothetical protein BI308_24720 [Roseofilum reptotaenium AO1-A]